MENVLFFDSTLRDGSHAIKHQLTKKNIMEYCQAIDDAGMYTTIVGHGNGLGASSLQVGQSQTSDHDMLTTARDNLKKTKLGVYLIPGFGTIKDDVKPALELGVELFCVGCHCTEANVTRQHMEYIREQGKEVYGVLMMYHMASLDQLLEETIKMQTYGAQGVIIMDSAGASTPELVKKTISTLYNKLDIKVGFHAHNNMGLAVANSYIAYNEGASIIDGTIRGFGAGAGNCQLEALVALMNKNNIQTDAQLYRMLDASEDIIKNIAENDNGLSALSIVSGMAGVFSAFSTHVERAAKRFQVNPRDIFVELGRRKAVAGQEDMIIEIAAKLQEDEVRNQNLSF
jgi:4-hydroxy 2-oxovalerate aldolase